MKVTIFAFLAIQLAVSIQDYSNLDVFNAEVDKEFRDFLKHRNLNDQKQRERYLKDNVKKEQNNDKKKRKLIQGQEQLDDLVKFLLTETDPNKYKPPVVKQNLLENAPTVHKQQQVVQTMEAEHQHEIKVHKKQPQQPVVLSPTQNNNDLKDFFEELLGKGNWLDDKPKINKRNKIEPEDDSEDHEHNHHWQQQKQCKEPLQNKDIGDIPIDHNLFKIESNEKDSKPKHMLLNQQKFDEAHEIDSFNLDNHHQIQDNIQQQQSLEQIVEKLSFYEHKLKQENETSMQTKHSILVLLQQISSKFHLPKKFEDDIKMLFEQDGLKIDDSEHEAQMNDMLQDQKMNQILGLIGFNNLATLEQNSVHDEQHLDQNVQNPLNIEHDIDHILEQYLKEKEQRDQQVPIQQNINQEFENPLLVLGELLNSSQHVQPQDQIHNLQDQVIQSPKLDEPIHIVQENPISQNLQNQEMINQEQIIPINNQVEQEGQEIQNILNQLQTDQKLLDVHPDEQQHLKNDQNINMINEIQNQELLDEQEPLIDQKVDQNSPVDLQDSQVNVDEINNLLENQQKNQENVNVVEQHDVTQNKEQMHHFTITLNDEDKGTNKTYKINCMKGNCENEDKDSPIDVQYHSSHPILI